ncbi:DUF4198 domain-containing protein [Sphingobacterium cavernae]|uniref:DUF4198 domain-containing protein n=1 Tax=Sphingobacterium cavernae TaxID=2592657 RepID=UPI0012301B8C|nr:DUF4198 domain-containing protein [Sphingobacterium cavernae]
MKTVKLIVMLLSIFACKMVSAHALWIETIPLGAKGKEQELKIYYGEYSEGLIEPLDKWYSDVKDFKIYVLSPSKKKTELLKAPVTDYYKATFTPSEEGTHIVYIEHPAKDTYKTTAFEFLAMAKVQLGNITPTPLGLSLTIDLDPKYYKVGDLINAKIMRNNEIFVNAEVEVVLPDGWVKKFKTNNSGIISFSAPLKGKYLLEVTDTENKDTNWFGTTIDKIWRVNTVVIFVK